MLSNSFLQTNAALNSLAHLAQCVDYVHLRHLNSNHTDNSNILAIWLVLIVKGCEPWINSEECAITPGSSNTATCVSPGQPSEIIFFRLNPCQDWLAQKSQTDLTSTDSRLVLLPRISILFSVSLFFTRLTLEAVKLGHRKIVLWILRCSLLCVFVCVCLHADMRQKGKKKKQREEEGRKRG